MTTRERVHHLVDNMPEDDLEAIERYLDRLEEAATDPVQRAFLRAATLMPEKLSPGDAQALDEALAEDQEISHSDIRGMLRNDL